MNWSLKVSSTLQTCNIWLKQMQLSQHFDCEACADLTCKAIGHLKCEAGQIAEQAEDVIIIAQMHSAEH